MTDAPLYVDHDHEVTVTLLLTTTHPDLRRALDRSGIAPGLLIGEALIEAVEVTERES